MSVIAELETEHGTFVYLNPRHVASVVHVDCSEPPMSMVRTVDGLCWTVRGEARSVVCHLLASDTPGRIATIARPGHPLWKERMLTDAERAGLRDSISQRIDSLTIEADLVAPPSVSALAQRTCNLEARIGMAETMIDSLRGAAAARP